MVGQFSLPVDRADERSWLIRLPQEGMCQALNIPPTLKYESDGGSGMERIMMSLLKSNKEPIYD